MARHSLLVVVVCAAACSLLNSYDEVPQASSAGGDAGSASGGTSSQGGAAGDGASHMGGEPGTGGAGGTGSGGSMKVLVDRGLVARYYIDEAASGTAPPSLLDAAQDPFDLFIDYTGVSFTEVMGQRGITKPMDTSGRASRAIAGTKIAIDLEGKSQVTLEAVVETGPVQAHKQRIMTIAAGGTGPGLAMMIEDSSGALELGYNNNGGSVDSSGVFAVNVTALSRVVLHVVVDTTLPTAAERTRGFVDGIEVPLGTPLHPYDPPAASEPMIFDLNAYLTIANREGGDRSFVGEIFYVAIYALVLDDSEIGQNASLLITDDDTP